MSALDKLADDESFQAFRTGALEILASMDDPAEVHELVESGEYEEALAGIDMEDKEVETKLELMQVLAREVSEENEELIEELDIES
jgi:vacuolar-type H+-ATPase subunit C/Vma6